MTLNFTFHLIAALTVIIFSILVFLKNRKNIYFAFLGTSIFVWLIASSMAYISQVESQVLFWFKISYIGIIFIPSTFYNFVFSLLEQKQKRTIFFNYSISLFFVFLLYFSNYLVKGLYKYSWGYYPQVSFIAHFPFLLFFNILFTIPIITLFFNFWHKTSKLSSISKNRLKYVFIGSMVGTLGAVDFLPNYGINIYPFGFIFMVIFPCIFTYAILKYQLMDIKLALTRAGVFVVVYTFVLGIPLYLGYRYGLWMYSTWITIFLASAGPFVFMYLQRRAEEVVFKEQRHYQQIINNLSKSMIDIRDLDALLNTITATITEAVKIDSARIYIKDNEYKSFRLRSCNPQEAKLRFEELIPFEHSLVGILRKQEKPLLSEEAGPQDKISLDSGLIIPCFGKDGLIAIIVLGTKPDNQMYTPDDLLVFENLSYAASLAIENCDYFKQIEEQQRQSRVKEMDMFSYSLAHEIFNPMYVITGEVESLQKYFLKYITDPNDYKEAENACKFALEASQRVSGMVEAIQEFGKKSTGEFSALKLEDILESFLKLYTPLFKTHGIFFSKELPKEIPFIRGSKQELIEVMVIFSNNAIHALLGTEDKEKHIDLKVKVYNPDRIRIALSDNGYGIAKEKLHSIFAPFVTTKASTEGTGMGLYTAKRIVERHNGKIWAESEGKGKGAAFFVELPIAKDVTEEDLKKEDKGKILFKNP